MKMRRASLLLAAILFAGTAVAADQIKPPFKREEVDAPGTVEIWGDYGDGYIATNDPDLNVFTARLKTPEGDDLVISQLNAPYVCGSDACPIRIVRNGTPVYDDGACRYIEDFTLNPSMRTLFACDTAIPTIEAPKE